MSKGEQITALISSYIELGQNEGYDDSQIIDALTDIFDREELEWYGFGDFVKSYFDDKED